jgi:hypothetical protein
MGTLALLKASRISSEQGIFEVEFDKQMGARAAR